VFPNVPAAATIAGTLATPFKPFLVSFANTMAMELKFLHRWRRCRGPCRRACLRRPPVRQAAASSAWRAAGLKRLLRQPLFPSAP
jgi:hypothetical protein